MIASWTFPPHVHSVALHWAGVALVLTGLALAIWARRALGRSFTMFPRPPDDATLATEGPFALVRHPIYTGGILVFAGGSLVVGLWGLAVTAVLAVLWFFKSRVEERHLAERFPAYAEYRVRVRRRFIPFVV